MDDDINTPGGVAVLFELAKELQKEGNRLTHGQDTTTNAQTLRAHWQTLVVLAQVLGLETKTDVVGVQTATLDTRASAISDADIEALIQQRQDARKAKNWAESDRIRDELQAQGITLIDQPGGVTRWHRS
jgi:cysteinyl-tRNA synthetase